MALPPFYTDCDELSTLLVPSGSLKWTLTPCFYTTSPGPPNIAERLCERASCRSHTHSPEKNFSFFCPTVVFLCIISCASVTFSITPSRIPFSHVLIERRMFEYHQNCLHPNPVKQHRTFSLAAHHTSLHVEKHLYLH